MVTDVAVAAEAVRESIAGIPDPEVPVVTIADLGILREVTVDESGRTARVVITPTYSGCPAMEAIRDRIEHETDRHGYAATVELRLAPAWTTDWLTAAGKEKLREFGIAPPGPREAGAPVALGLSVRRVTCPLCGSIDTTELSHFGSTACKALRCCNSCREPFDEFKAL